MEQQQKPEPVLMSSETVLYFRESLAEIKADLKDIKKTQHDHDKDLGLLKYKMMLLAAVSGGGAHLGLKFFGL